MISDLMRRALEIFEESRYDTHWFADMFWPDRKWHLARNLPGTAGHAEGQQFIDQMVTAGLLQPHWKTAATGQKYELTTRGRTLLEQAQREHDDRTNQSGKIILRPGSPGLR